MAPFVRIVAALALVGVMGMSLTPTPPVRAAPSAQATVPRLSVDRTRIQPGQILTVFGRGFRPDTSVVISMGGSNAGSSGHYGAATADRSGRFTVAVLLLCYSDGSPLRPGAIVLVAHNTLNTESAGQRLT